MCILRVGESLIFSVIQTRIFINPQRASARVTVVTFSVCLSVSVCVSLSVCHKLILKMASISLQMGIKARQATV